MKNLLLKGGTLVSARGTRRADVLISGEKIIAVGRRLTADAQVADVSGKLIFPGFIDASTHFGAVCGEIVSTDDFAIGTCCALAGGVTTVVDCAVPRRGEALTDALNVRHIGAFAHSGSDYGFHMTITEWNEEIKKQLPAMIEQGVSSFIAAMDGDNALSDREMYEMMIAAKACGGIVGCRCGSTLADKLSEEALARGEKSPAAYAKAHPDYLEAAAVHRFLAIAKAADAPCIVMNLSTRAGCEEVLRARQNGVRAYAATCPRYLLLDDSAYDAPFANGAGFVCAPPLRRAEDHKALWEMMRSGSLSAIGSDHCAFSAEQRMAGESDFRKIPVGMPGVDSSAVLLYTYGVKKHRLSLPQLCAYLSENPARLYGMYPKKGAIRIGSDADLVVFDPKGRGSVTASGSGCEYSPFEGMRTEGRVEQVYLRGRLAYRAGDSATEHRGKYLCRGKGMERK